MTIRPTARAGGLLAVAAGLAGCGFDAAPTGSAGDAAADPCAGAQIELFDGGVSKDGIPALTDPVMAGPGERGAEYLDPEDRVIGFVVEGQPVAFPHSLGWHHEILNLEVGDRRVAATYCPLTGSSLVFDRSAVGGAEFGVSGLLHHSNLVMYDRRQRESFWPQMDRRARCGSATGTTLELVPAVEMTWGGWAELHPGTWVPANLSSEGQWFADYQYPYGNYEEIDNERLLFPVPAMDERRPPKERVLGISRGSGSGGPGQGDGSIAFPFGALDAQGPVAVVEEILDDRRVAVFWNREREAAVAHHAWADGRGLRFRVEEGDFVDEETGSRWNLAGRAVAGDLEGAELEPVADAYVAFWFAWAVFHPNTRLWGEG